MNKKTRTEYSLLNIATGLGGYVLNTVLGFVCRMVFVHCLSADYLGVNGLFINVLSMLSLAELGIGSAIVYALYKPLAENDEDKIASLVDFYGKAYRIIGIIIAILGLCLLPFLNVIIKEQPNISESIYLLYLINLFNTSLTYFFSYKSSLIIAAQQNYIVGGINYLITIAQSIIQIVILLLTNNYLLYLLVQTIGTCVFNVTISMVADKKFPYIKNKKIKALGATEMKSLFRNIRDLTIYKISGLLVNSTDNILITFFSGLTTTGIASNYTLLVNMLNSLISQVFNGLIASVGNHNATNENEKKYELFNFLNLMNFWIFGWASLGIVFCSSDIVKLCFGSDYVLHVSIPIVLALNFFTVGMQNAVWTYKQTLGLFKYGRFMQIFTAIFNLTFSVVLGYKFNLFGILIATFFARLLTNLWYDPYVVFKFGFEKSIINYIKKYIWYITIITIAAFSCNLILKAICLPILMQVLLKMFLCSLITNLVFLIAFYKTKEFTKLLEILKKVINLTKINS